MKFLCILAALIALTSGQQHYRHEATFYEGQNGGGASVFNRESYWPDMGSYPGGWNDRARSVCANGVWLFYDYPNYNLGYDAGMEYFFGPNNNCVNFGNLGGRVSSARFVGEPANYRASTITFYEGSYFQGEEEYAVNDLPNLNLYGRIRSLIVTGDQGWTVYTGSNWLGEATCIFPPQPFTPAFIFNTEQIGVNWGTIRSVRKGCAGKELRPEIEAQTHGVHTV